MKKASVLAPSANMLTETHGARVNGKARGVTAPSNGLQSGCNFLITSLETMV